MKRWKTHVWEKELNEDSEALLQTLLYALWKILLKKRIQPEQQTKGDHTISSNHTNAFPHVVIEHTSNHFTNQLASIPKEPPRDHLKEKWYI